MEKTISINLNNQNFQIEEQAYEKLANYLESIKKHCGNGADTAEVIADIENSMAEKLKSTLKPYKEVITENDVDSLIRVMGTVEDFDREVGDSPETKSETDSNRTKHKFYRDTDNAVIAGVCSGLGAYFDADPVIFRIIFIVLLFCRGGGFLLYIILWIAMPEAKTAHQKLEMQGQAPTLAALKNISKNEKKNFQDRKEQWKKRTTASKILNLPILVIDGLLLAVKKVWRALWPVIVLCFGLTMLVGSFVGLGFVGVGSLLALLYGHSPYLINFAPVTLLTNMMPYSWMVATGFLSLIIPGIFTFIIGLMIVTKKRLINLKATAIMLVIWLIAAIVCISLCIRYVPEAAETGRNYPLTKRTQQALDLKGIKTVQVDGPLLDVYVSTATDTPAMIDGRKIEMDYIQVKRQGDQLLLQQIKKEEPNQTCFECHLHPLEVTLPTSTAFKIEAKNDANVEYATIEKEENEDDDRTGDLNDTDEEATTTPTLKKTNAPEKKSVAEPKKIQKAPVKRSRS